MEWSEDDLARIKKRDPEIFNKMYIAYKDKIFQYIYIKTKKNIEMTEDIISETFYSAIQSAPGIKNTKNLFSWLLQIANRRYSDYFRKHFHDKKLHNVVSIHTVEDSPATEEASIENERLLLTQIAIDTLNPLYRKIIILKYIEKRSQKEISHVLHKSVYSVESILFRARKALKKKIKELLKD